MAFNKANVLSTRESAFGNRWLGQVIPVPSGRLDKVSPYLEPVVANPIAAESIMVIAEVYAVDGFGIPTGMPLVSDSMSLAQISIRGRVNFRLEAYVPSVIAFVLRTSGGDADNHVAWRYENSTSGANLLLSVDGGASWLADPLRTFSYQAFSISLNAIDYDQQTARILPGTMTPVVDDTGVEFAKGTFDRAFVVGNTVEIKFGKYVVTLVVDQSGSMTWNDRDGLRFDFLRQLVADLDAAIAPLPAPAAVTFSIVKFRGRRIGKLKIEVAGTEDTGLDFNGVRILRKAGLTPPLNSGDGTEIYRDIGERFEDQGLTAGTTYQYAAYSFATFPPGAIYSDEGRLDAAKPVAPPSPPLGTAGLNAEVIATDAGGSPLAEGATDLGYRDVQLSWLNPAGYTGTDGYSNILLTRRTDRYADSPTDGTVDGTTAILLPFTTTPATISFLDDFGGSHLPINGLTYYYRLFTENASGTRCLSANALEANAAIPVADRPWERSELAGAWPPGSTPPAEFSVAPLPPTYAVKECSGEIRLDWLAADLLAKRFKLFYRKDRYPLPTDDKQRAYDGEVLYDGTALTFTHRFLENGQPYFYVLVAFDERENVSTPVEIAVSGQPPKPNAASTVYVSPLPVTSFTAEATGSSSTLLTWTNPSPPAGQNSFFFGDVVNISALVEYLDPGDSETFSTFEFVEDSRIVSAIASQTAPAATQAIIFSRSAAENASSIAAAVSVTPLLAFQNTMESASIALHAELSIKNRATGETIAKAKTDGITITFANPFVLSVKNDPPQTVSVRTWGVVASVIPGEEDVCQHYEYKIDSVPGVYVLSGNPFFAIIEATFRNGALGSPLDVTLELLDQETGEPTRIVEMSQAAGQPTFVLQATDQDDEVLDRNGQPTGNTVQRTLLPLILPPGNVPGKFLLQATATFEGYVKTATMEIRYEPVLNIDLNLNPYQPDHDDRTEQSAFVYLAPFDAPQSQKVAVPDFTVTDWSIRALCKNADDRPLQSEDPLARGVGVKALTRGGLAQKIFWGPGENVEDEQDYEVTVKAQSGGMAATGYGILRLSPVRVNAVNRILLRNPTGFFMDTMCANGIAFSTWEVVAKPEDESGGTDSGQAFRQAILSIGGLVPSLEDGRTVTLVATVDTSQSQEAITAASILNNVLIKTNLSPKGRPKSAKATISNGKATFEVACNARVPKPQETMSGEELVENIAYKIYGISFSKPKSGAYIVLTAYVPLAINGGSVSFAGGGGNVVTSTPPAFIELVEPLRSS